MTVNATFHPVQGAGWRWRIVITGVFKVFVPDRPRFTVVHRTDPVRLLSDLRAALLDTWNSSSESVVVRGERYLVHFELRAIPGGHEDHIQRLVNAFDAGGEGPKLQLHHACRRLGWNIVVGFHDSGEHVISGRVPPAPPFHRGRARHVHQPWSNVVLLAHDCSRYTIGHEIGHVLGLGEGYRDYLRYVERNGHQIAADVDRRTIPEAAGTPMALAGDAGRDPNDDQLSAIVTYCLRAKAETTADRAFGPEVDGYRARIMR